MKKIIGVCICLALVLSLAGCGHKHAVTKWTADAKNHFYICECGDRAEEGPHELDEDSSCTVCGAGVYDEGDGQTCVMTYDEWGSCDSCIYYDPDGSITFAQYDEREYYEDGNPKLVKVYMDGVLTYETHYEPCKDDETCVYVTEDISYMEDGSKYVILYLNEDEIESSTIYNPDGSVMEQTTYEYDRDKKGNILGRRTYTNGVLNEETKSFVGPDDSIYESSIIFYDPDGSVSLSNEYVYEFDDDGNQTYHAYYYNGVINLEYFSALDADGNVYTAREVEYDEAGNVISDISYNAEGSVID